VALRVLTASTRVAGGVKALFTGDLEASSTATVAVDFAGGELPPRILGREKTDKGQRRFCQQCQQVGTNDNGSLLSKTQAGHVCMSLFGTRMAKYVPGLKLLPRETFAFAKECRAPN
jgi:hypothetical protein